MSELIVTQFKVFYRNFINVFFVFVFPVFFIILFGEIYGNDPSSFFNGKGTLDVSTPAYIAMIISVTGIMSFPLTIANYREQKILKRLKATPMNPVNLLVSEILVNVVMTILGVILLFFVASMRYGVEFSGNLKQFILAFLLSIFSTFSIGGVIASISSNVKMANAIANLVYFPMLFLSGATIPIEIMPESIQEFSKFIPLTHAVNLLKKTWLGEGIAWGSSNVIVLIVILIICTAISAFYFKWD
ncbi:ABC transporter permease [Vagococcus elongatus]|uniref:Transport permease protein n=1 Tax=Vagococcus elongatus TaxID=180344 RepID=A0A430B5Q4_9ENTE|nr:ABC transporter permease [Vagococcus elongatus]RSU15636.1 hypothetical protein CBF29_00750 [Vagococcus elongatus]